MENKFLCRMCEEEYDLEERVPRILKQCGHCICTLCLQSAISKGLELSCPIDGTEIPLAGQTIEDFPQNVSLIHIISIKKE